jgi:hypothetical protein
MNLYHAICSMYFKHPRHLRHPRFPPFFITTDYADGANHGVPARRFPAPKVEPAGGSNRRSAFQFRSCTVNLELYVACGSAPSAAVAHPYR